MSDIAVNCIEQNEEDSDSDYDPAAEAMESDISMSEDSEDDDTEVDEPVIEASADPELARSESIEVALPLPIVKRMCGICLGHFGSNEEDIVECDSCGIMTHEECYSLDWDETSSKCDALSDGSTVPWFCDACCANEHRPKCKLCPNEGGIFKETDDGQWVHLLCALYVPRVAFHDLPGLRQVTLCEMSPSQGSPKKCGLCKDPLLAGNGEPISCDAGYCKNYFHVTCAQAAGLLEETADSETFGPYFAQCAEHTEKALILRRKRRYKQLQRALHEGLQQRLKRPLKKRALLQLELQNWQAEYAAQKQTWVTAEPKQETDLPVEAGFNAAFVEYYDQRSRSLEQLDKDNAALMQQGDALNEELLALKQEQLQLLSEKKALLAAKQQRQAEVEQLRNQLAKLAKCDVVPADSCLLCSGHASQDNSAQCDRCKRHYHLGCLKPPLKRKPASSHFYAWQCAKCFEAQYAARNALVSGPRISRSLNSDAKYYGSQVEDGVSDFQNDTSIRKRSYKLALSQNPHYPST